METLEKIGRLAALGLVLMAMWTAPLAAAGKGRADLFEEQERAELLVVRITAPSTEGAGIIFHIDSQYAYGVTAKHVLYQQGKMVQGLKAQFRAWPGQQLSVEGFKLHHEEDLAVFRADIRPLNLSVQEILQGVPLDQLGASEKLDPKDALYSMGHSTAGGWIAPKEEVRFAQGDGRNSFLFEYPCPQGHSGGGVFDGEWRLVGMMIEEERPYCRALRIEPILRIVQGWKIDIDLRSPPSLKREQALEQDITVAVVDFDNRSTKNLPHLGFVAQDITTSFLNTLPGVVLVTRDRLDSVKREVNLSDSVRTGTGISRVGRLLEADALITGSVLRYDVERRTFTGFDTSALQDIFRMSISLQILDVDTGRVRFSKTFDVERAKQYPKATSAPSQPIDRTSELLTALLDLAQNDIKSALSQVAAGLGAAGGFIKIPVRTTPAGADVILNGSYMGRTPFDIEVTLDSHELQLELAGYKSWRQRLKARPGMTVEVNLVPKHR